MESNSNEYKYYSYFTLYNLKNILNDVDNDYLVRFHLGTRTFHYSIAELITINGTNGRKNSLCASKTNFILIKTVEKCFPEEVGCGKAGSLKAQLDEMHDSILNKYRDLEEPEYGSLNKDRQETFNELADGIEVSVLALNSPWNIKLSKIDRENRIIEFDMY